MLGEYRDIPDFCKSASFEDIRKHDYALMPDRYVGEEAQDKDDELSAKLRMARCD
jgi:type I restriction enzyme M protein